MSFRALDAEIEVRPRRREGSMDGGYRGNAGLFGLSGRETRTLERTVAGKTLAF